MIFCETWHCRDLCKTCPQSHSTVPLIHEFMDDHIWDDWSHWSLVTTNPQVKLIWSWHGSRKITTIHIQLSCSAVRLGAGSLFPWQLPCWALIVTHGTVAARESGGLGRPRHSATRGLELHGRGAGSAKRSAWDWGRWKCYAERCHCSFCRCWRVTFSSFALVFKTE